MFSFQKLKIYQLAKELVKHNYRLTDQFPGHEKYALVQQMNRAAISVPSNIAEGTSRKTANDKMHFISISYGSLMELTCQVEISSELGYITELEFLKFSELAKDLAVKLSNYTAARKRMQCTNG